MLRSLSRIADRAVAYFSMEVALKKGMATYAGGLGILAGDVMRSAADLNLPIVGVTLANRAGYFKQLLGPSGQQQEAPDAWSPERYAAALGTKVVVRLEERSVWIGAWLYQVASRSGASVPVILLDTNLPENGIEDRTLTDRLYGGDAAYRLKQEAILGIGGVRMLRALAMHVVCFHMNEGHSALLGLELRRSRERVRCVFTTHTPVDAGHDRFPYPLVSQVLKDYFALDELKQLGGKDQLNMTQLALSLADYVNGVARRHVEVSQGMFPAYKIRAITNGVHPYTWTSEPMRSLYNHHIPDWDQRPERLMHAGQLKSADLWAAHLAAKAALLRTIRERGGPSMNQDLPIIGFARRMTAYKRTTLIFREVDRLKSIAAKYPFQIVCAGKAHPRDTEGKQDVEQLHRHAAALSGTIDIAFLADYDMDLALTLVSGSDLWLNTPLPPLEASGTSGMKAAFNGVPNLSVLDGWWQEGCIEGVTGWAIGDNTETNDESHAAALYDKLERVVLPLWHEDREGWISVMKGAIGRNANYFNSHRMMHQYAAEAYLL